MKHLKTTGLALIALVFISFSLVKEKSIDVDSSTISWIGKKVTGQHEGILKLQSGTLKFKNNSLIGGDFIVDMSSITVTDLSGKGKGKLEGHLKSNDFFGVAKHKIATLKITSAKKQKNGNYSVSADLTIKGITKPLDFQINVDDDTATANVKIDRTKYDIRYGSASFFDNLKDKAIYDEFDLSVTLKF